MILKLRNVLLRSFKSKRINVFLLFFLLSFVVLVLTKLSKPHTDTLVFTINKKNVPQEYVILNDPSSVLTVTLKTHGFRWLKYYLEEPKIDIDFQKDVYKKDSLFVWSKSKAFLNNTQFDSQVELLNISPDTLKFKYSVNMIKKVPVKLNSKIEFRRGYDILGHYKISPDSVEIVGPRVIVSKIKDIKTDKLVLADRKSNISESLKLQLPSGSDQLKFSKQHVTLKATVEKFTEGDLKIPVSLINVPENVDVNFFPKEVNVSYYVSLSQYNSVKSSDFKVVCDYSEVGDNQSFLIPKLIESPNSIKKSRIHQQRIEFIVR